MKDAIREDHESEYVRNARLMDDYFFELCFGSDPKYIEAVINGIFGQLNIPLVKITEIKTQKRLLTVENRNACLDAVATDENGNLINIEVQKAKKSSLFKRARYHSSLLDTNNLTSGEDFSQLPDTYVIFILEYDLRKQELPAYQVKRTFLEDNSDFDDGTRFIFVNGTYRGDDPIGILMHDFNVKGAKQMKNAMLKERVEFFKETEEGTREMKGIEEIIAARSKAEGLAEGEAKGKIETATEIAKKLLMLNVLSLEGISKSTGLSLEEVEDLKKSIFAPE